MSTPYHYPWQSSAYSLHDTQHGPPLSAAVRPLDSYVYPPKPNHTNSERPFHPFPAPRQHDMTDGALLRGGTPSPTPSEQKELNKGAVDWKAMSNWRFWVRKEWIWYYVALVLILILVALMTLYHKQIVDWLTPVTRWLHDLSFGWIVPIAILFVISFPPLFGHEIVAILCGLVWGLWIGFAIVAAGTFLGEVGNFYAFKYCCRSRGEKLEREKISYACLAKIVRDGGFKIALIARLSAIPGHFTTAVFSTCGMGIIVFSIAAILSLPKQFITVYLGVILEQSESGTTDTKSRIISDVVLAVTTIITGLSAWYLLHQMDKVKPDVIYAKRKARQAKLERQHARLVGHTQNSSYTTLHTADYSYSNSSESEIPLTSRAMPMGYAPAFPEPKHFQDSSAEYSNEPHLHAPMPQRAGRPMPQLDVEDETSGTSEPPRPTFEPQSGSPRISDRNSESLVYSSLAHGASNPHDASHNSRNTFSVGPEDHSSGRPLDFSGATQFPPSSPAHHYLVQRVAPEQQNTPMVAGSTSEPRFNNFLMLSQDQRAIGPAHASPQGYQHIPEESYDSFHTAHIASPEPMTLDDELPGTSQPSTAQQGPSAGLRLVDTREQPPRPRSRPLPEYDPQQR